MGVGGRGTVQELLAVETQITIKLGQRVGGQRNAEDITKVVEAPDVFLQSAHCAMPFVFLLLSLLVDIVSDFHFTLTTN